MTVILTVEDRGGMLFMKRRLSKDRLPTLDIVNMVGDGILYINEFSEALFFDSDISVLSVPDPLSSAAEQDFVFIENLPLAEHIERVDKLIIYKWNRAYPFDTAIDVTPIECGFTLAESYDFEGYSHKKITREVYTR